MKSEVIGEIVEVVEERAKEAGVVGIGLDYAGAVIFEDQGNFFFFDVCGDKFIEVDDFYVSEFVDVADKVHADSSLIISSKRFLTYWGVFGFHSLKPVSGLWKRQALISLQRISLCCLVIGFSPLERYHYR